MIPFKSDNGEQQFDRAEDGIPACSSSRVTGRLLFVRLYKRNGPLNKRRLVGKNRRRPPHPSFAKVQGANSYLCRCAPPPLRARHIATIIALALAGGALSGCGTINEKLAGGVSDAIPAWAGGLPADAPPRPGTAKYEEFMKERERKRLMPASERGEETKSTPPSQQATH